MCELTRSSISSIIKNQQFVCRQMCEYWLQLNLHEACMFSKARCLHQQLQFARREEQPNGLMWTLRTDKTHYISFQGPQGRCAPSDDNGLLCVSKFTELFTTFINLELHNFTRRKDSMCVRASILNILKCTTPTAGCDITNRSGATLPNTCVSHQTEMQRQQPTGSGFLNSFTDEHTPAAWWCPEIISDPATQTLCVHHGKRWNKGIIISGVHADVNLRSTWDSQVLPSFLTSQQSSGKTKWCFKPRHAALTLLSEHVPRQTFSWLRSSENQMTFIVSDCNWIQPARL